MTPEELAALAAAERSAQATEDTGSFEAIFNNVMNIPTAGRDVYTNWLANRWREAASNWALSSSDQLNRVAVMDNDPSSPTYGQQKFTEEAVLDAEGNATDEMKKNLTWDLGERVGESFEEYMTRLKDSTELFGGTSQGNNRMPVGYAGYGNGMTDPVGTAVDPAGRGNANFRLNQLSGMGGDEQRGVFESLSRLLSGSGISGSQVGNEAFLNASENRFGRRGAAAVGDRIFNRNEALEYDRARLAGDYGQNDSFLNTRLSELRQRYGF